MADFANSIPAPDVHPLNGSSRPGAAPRYTPKTTPRPRPQVRPRIQALPAPAPALSTITSRLVPLIKREHGVQCRLQMLEQHDLLPDLRARLDRISVRMLNRIWRWTHQLMQHRPVDTRIFATKANAYVELVVAGWTGGTDEIGDNLALSVAHDAIRLGVEATCLPVASDPIVSLHQQAAETLSSFNVGAYDGTEGDALFDQLASLRESALQMPATNVSGALASLEWARMEFAAYYIEPQANGDTPDWLDRFTLNLLDGAIRVLRPYSLATPTPTGDRTLFELIAQHGPAIAESDAAEKAAQAPHALWAQVALNRPYALRWRAEDRTRPQTKEKAPGDTGYFLVYAEADVERMRNKHAVTVVEHRSPAPWNVDEVVIRGERLPDPVGEARRLEIVGAWDAWVAEQAMVAESSGLNAANVLVDEKSEAAYAIERAIWDYNPITFAGLQAKARWIAATPAPSKHAKYLLRDLCSMGPASDANDAPVLAAVAEFCRLDDLQDHLCRTHNADTDDIPGYAATEEPWQAWLDAVAERPALTWEGIVAKAATMKRHTVNHDLHASDCIGESLAEDILRLAGRTWDERSNRIPRAVRVAAEQRFTERAA